jgi:hypothetical protein
MCPDFRALAVNRLTDGVNQRLAIRTESVTPQPPAALRDLQREESVIEAGHGAAARP